MHVFFTLNQITSRVCREMRLYVTRIQIYDWYIYACTGGVEPALGAFESGCARGGAFYYLYYDV